MTDTKTTQKNFRFSDENLRQFDALVEHFGETDSDVIRRLIAERYVALFGVPEKYLKSGRGPSTSIDPRMER